MSPFHIEIICTGDEIVSGKTVNTNFSHMARRLTEEGLAVTRETTIGDDREQLASSFLEASKRADAVIVNGGLGPTVDDLSQEVAAQVAGVPLELNQAWYEKIKEYYADRGRKMPSSNRKQALLPRGSEVIDNPVGTACGFELDVNHARFYFTPGVPRELKRMLDDQIIPSLRERSGLNVLTRLKRFHTFGIGESRADVLLKGVMDQVVDSSVKLGFQSHYPQLETKLMVQGNSETDLEGKLSPVERSVREILGNFVLAEDEQTIEQRIIRALGDINGSLATMEMFTGGAIASRLLPISGEEGLLKRGVVSRELSQLFDAAGLDQKEIPQQPSVEVAMLLAQGIRSRSGSSHALVVLIDLQSHEQKREFDGRIFIGIAHPGGTLSRNARYRGGAEWVRLGAIEMGLDCMRRYLFNLPVDERIDFEEHS